MKQYILSLLIAFVVMTGIAQPVYIDQPIECGDLIVFPHITDTTKFYYLANKIGLGTTISGKPQFSFLRYVQNVGTGADEATREEGDGGGIVHVLVELKVTDQQLAEAQAVLKKKTKRDNAVLMGPVIYKGGNFVYAFFEFITFLMKNNSHISINFRLSYCIGHFFEISL